MLPLKFFPSTRKEKVRRLVDIYLYRMDEEIFVNDGGKFEEIFMLPGRR